MISKLDPSQILPGKRTIDMAYINAGTFLMGGQDNSTRSKTVPVRIEEGFWMSVHPISQIQWRIVSAMPGIERPLDPAPSKFNGSMNLPVESVSWREAVEFCDRLSRFSGWHYRLPSEAEWEYACRAGTATRFSFGDRISKNQMNFAGEQINRTSTQGCFPPNPWGLFDMHGNVWEWCADSACVEPLSDVIKDQTPFTRPHQDHKYTQRMMRGGSWQAMATDCQADSRDGEHPDFRHPSVGFRVVCREKAEWMN
jgi:formylglycine-generating enzyme required for sulfatase activity